jgi:hypothetical protein
MTLSKRSLPASLALLAGLFLVRPCVSWAEGGQAVGPTPPRLAFTDGDVSFWRSGAEDWSSAQVNIPLAAGDAVYAGNGSNLEVEIGSRAFVRAGSQTELGLESLETGFLQFKVTGGHAAFDLQGMPEGQRIEVDTPNAAFTIDRPGYYRLDVDGGTTFATRRGGDARVIPAGGEASDVPDGHQVVLQGTETATVNASGAPALDDWDRWNNGRSSEHPEHPQSAAYVPPDVAGSDDLDRDGDWRETPRYGHVWVPRQTPADWAPYSTGRWVWDPYYGWTWVDDAPWGWAPYHYGRWVDVGGYWGWAPGPFVSAAVYAPALVGFLGPVGVSVNVGIGIPVPPFGWVALGFGEPVLPWWGPVGFVGRPYWCGWGGPRVVNNVVINNTRIVNATTINRFQNMGVRNAVIGVPHDQFGRGRIQPARLGPNQVRGLQPIRGSLGVRPVAASLVPNAGRGQRPPQQIATRAVVATRAPQDPAHRLQAAGIPAASAARASEVRLVQPRQTAHLEASGRGRVFAHEPPPPPASSRERQAAMGDQQHAPMGDQRHASIGSSEAGIGRHTERGLAAPVPPAGAGGRERNQGGRTTPPPHAAAEHHATRGGTYAHHAPRPPVSHHAMPRPSAEGRRAAPPPRQTHRAPMESPRGGTAHHSEMSRPERSSAPHSGHRSG